MLGPESKVGFTQFPEWTYSAVKNSLEEGSKKAAAGVPPRTASEGEVEFYGYGARLMRMVGAKVEEAKPWKITGKYLINLGCQR